MPLSLHGIMKKLFILDASGYIYRSYFAITQMTNGQGESTNALFGFLRSVMKLFKDFHPEHCVAVFDGPNNADSRTAIYAAYKAHRSSMPDDLRYQIAWARECCDLMGIPHLNISGVEADDAMGSVAVWAANLGTDVFLCSGDKDLCQFVDEKIKILNTFKDNLILGSKEVEEQFGVPPRLIVDFLAITGDASDNVPGLSGFGPKTAAALLKQYGSLNAILAAADAMQGKKRETIINEGSQALLSKRLIEIDTSLDIPKEESYYRLKEPNVPALKEFYTKMRFHSLLKELISAIPAKKENERENEMQITHSEATHPHETMHPTVQADLVGEIVNPSEATKERAAPLTRIVNYNLVDDETSYKALLCALQDQKEICINIEATSERFMEATIVGIGFCYQEAVTYYLPFNGFLAHMCGVNVILEKLKIILENPKIAFYGHNIKRLYGLLAGVGIQVATFSFDTMLASYALNAHHRQHSLNHLVLEHFGKVLPTILDPSDKKKRAVPIADADISKASTYTCSRVDAIYELKQIFSSQIGSRNLQHLLYDIEIPLAPVLAKMERHGIYLNVPYLHVMSEDISLLIRKYEQEIYTMAGETFNINSPKQLSVILFDKLGIKPPKKTATGLSTNVDVLESLKEKYPIAIKLLEYRTIEKLRSTYVDALPNEVNPHTHRIHCNFNQTVAATGRLSSQDPNLQNIPVRSEIGRKIRAAFCPEKAGWSFLAADYSQIELRLLAHYSEDPELMRAFHNNEDVHTHTAATIFNIPINEVTKIQRYQAKAVNFGIVYGQQAYGLSQELGIDVNKASAFINAYFDKFKRVKDFVESCKEKTRSTGKAVTLTGRERLIPEIHSKNGMLRTAAERLAVNTPLQGTAADLIKLAMISVDNALTAQFKRGYLILQIHDELLFEAPDEDLSSMETLVRKEMEEVWKLQVPLIVDVSVGKNWEVC